jgi:hypothetical protein
MTRGVSNKEIARHVNLSEGTARPHYLFGYPMRQRRCGAQTNHGRSPMFRTLMIGAVSALTLSAAAFAQQGGTAQEARAMLDKAVAAVKADQAVALAMFLKGEGGFLDRELYPFCFRIADGKTLASPKAVPAGTDVRTLKDASGNAYGVAIYAAAQNPEGQITEVPSYMFPKPGTTTPTFPKVSFVTKVGDLGCGVGYYK